MTTTDSPSADLDEEGQRSAQRPPLVEEDPVLRDAWELADRLGITAGAELLIG